MGTLLLYNGMLKTIGGALHTLPTGATAAELLACCCPGNQGCCSDQIVSQRTTFKAEVIGATNNCATVGETRIMDDATSPEIWKTNGQKAPGDGPQATSRFDDLQITCTNPDDPQGQLELVWDHSGAGCPVIDTSTTGTAWEWKLIEGSCTPFEWIYEWTFAEEGAMSCPCDSGTMRIKVTIDTP